MGYVVKMPKLGLEMEQGTLLEWHTAEGDTVTEGETIAEVESEKSIGEIDAREDGVLRLAHLGEGETVPPGTSIGIVAGAEEDITDLEAEFETGESTEPTETTEDEAGAAESAGGTESPQTASASTDVKASPKAKRRADELDIDLTGIDGTGPQGAITADDVENADTATETQPTTEQVKASPRAERRADELGVDLTTVDGTGPQGAITADDIEAVAETPSEEPPSEGAASSTTGTERVTATSEEWYRTTTLVTHGDEADVLAETTEMATNAFDFDVSVTDVLLLAVSAALGDHPEFNATFEDDTHHLHDRQDIALAVDADGELVTSVLPAVDERTFAELVEAGHGQMEQTDTDGIPRKRATFALANGEQCDDAQSLVTPPTVAGLVTHSHQRAIPAENGVSFRRYLDLSLAYDSRAVGDRNVEAFLDTLLERIEELPELVLRTYREE
ncbi:MAG TPA: E3 binding domain-containing protein [Halococcus sp.]|nr:E3 binding domain-containing protein [Halococcus sp.]